ncbi:hypothetical protein [Sporomusa carbonis]|uniref:hypothetical protein n=1 Tax=Sporomusa carbonis TaxID=3076075 RepID=UPI003C79EF45
MGGKTAGGTGCACPESVLLKSLLNHLVLDTNEAVIVDMEAGLEHLGRGTAQGVDAFIIVVEPGQRSLATARAIAKMAKDLGVHKVYAVVSKLHGVRLSLIVEALGDLPIIGVIPYKVEAVLADWKGADLFHSCPDLVEEAEKILDSLVKNKVNNGNPLASTIA